MSSCNKRDEVTTRIFGTIERTLFECFETDTFFSLPKLHGSVEKLDLCLSLRLPY